MLQEEVDQLQADLADFKLASQELEKELEADLEESQRQIDELNKQLTDALKSADAWRVKYSTALAEATANEEALKLKLQQAVADNTQSLHRIRAIEIENDDIERSERIAKSTVQELEEQNADLLEKLAVSDSALASANEELQRCKDELRETADELQATKDGLIKRVSSSAQIKNRTLRRMEGMRHQVETIEGQLEVVRRFSAKPQREIYAPQPAKRDRGKRPPVEMGREFVPDLRAIGAVPRSVSPGAGHGKPIDRK